MADRMARARRLGGLVWVALGTALQVAWYVRDDVVPGPVTLLLSAVIVLLTVAVLVRRGVRTLALASAVLLALDFFGAVADRFGVFGGPGRAGVSWGSWMSFVDYTARLLPGLDQTLVSLAAVSATAAEILLGGLLLSGWQRRWVGKGTAGLLAVYLVAMAWSLGLAAVAQFAVPTLVGGALLVSTVPASDRRRPFSVSPPPDRAAVA